MAVGEFLAEATMGAMRRVAGVPTAARREVSPMLIGWQEGIPPLRRSLAQPQVWGVGMVCSGKVAIVLPCVATARSPDVKVYGGDGCLPYAGGSLSAGREVALFVPMFVHQSNRASETYSSS